ncbi:hypothetical protein BC829DRAFT_446294 [Chytridium lagenaria]|nr:hypothetical protein BC829DRAFT_446294 [Chytridium lagenaria]
MRREGLVRCESSPHKIRTNKTVRKLHHPEYDLLCRLYIINDPSTSVADVNYGLTIGGAAKQASMYRHQCLRLYSQNLASTIRQLSEWNYVRANPELPRIHRLTTRLEEVKKALETKEMILKDIWGDLRKGSANIKVDYPLPSRDKTPVVDSGNMQKALTTAGFGDSRTWDSLTADEFTKLDSLIALHADYIGNNLYVRVKNVYATEEDARKRVERDRWKIQSSAKARCCRRWWLSVPKIDDGEGKRIGRLKGDPRDVLWDYTGMEKKS